MSTPPTPINVLFLCTHNSARSILAEALLNHLGNPRFRAFSAGSSPRDNQQPHPIALRVLQNAGIDTHSLSSKSWDAFAHADATHMHLIITVCDNAAGEVCPIWPGHPATAHWGYADPSQTTGSAEDIEAAFRSTLHQLHKRLESFINLPIESFDQQALQTQARSLSHT
jgi:protein-tyrosine-phosphatase